MSEYPSRIADKIVVRLPDGMRDRLAEIARENRRSVNAEVVAALESWVTAQPRVVNISTGIFDKLIALLENEKARSEK